MRFFLARFAHLAPAGALALLVAFLPLAAAAHEQRDTPSGRYSLTVGFLNEPAYQGEANAVFLDVVEYGGGPVEGLAATLKVDVRKDGQTATFDFLPGAEPGQYFAPFYPTATGDYEFRIYGQVGEEAIDETFRSSPNTFNPVESLAAVQFPVAPPDAATLEVQIEDAEDAAATARTIGVAGLVVGVLGVLVGLAAWLRRGRVAPATAAAPSAAAVEPAALDPDDGRLVARRTREGVPPDAPPDRRA